MDSGDEVLVTLGPRLDPDDAKKLGGDGFHVTYEEGEREGIGGRYRYGELKPA